MTWVKETPIVSGWYWMQYKNKRKTITVCPAYVDIMGIGTIVRSAFNDTFIEGPNHGGPGLKYMGKIDKSIKFGDLIPEPDL